MMPPISIRLSLVLTFAFMVSACGNGDETPEPDPQTAPQEAQFDDRDVDVAGNTADRSPAEPMQGAWYYKDTPGGPVALFGPPNTEASFTLRCDSQGERVAISFPAGRNLTPQMGYTLELGPETRSFDADLQDQGLTLYQDYLPLDDPWVEKLEDYDGNIRFTAEARSPMTLPASTEMQRAIQRCRDLTN